MTFISIIIPFNKGERYLKDCLDSLSEQNLSNEEVILIINGFNENIDELINEYSELNIITKTFDEELGVGRARNEGLRISNGEYIYFLDSDDYIYADGLSKLIEVAKKTNADFINGERINTPFIKERSEEIFVKKSNNKIKKKKIPLKQNKLSDKEFAIKLLVGEKTSHKEILSVLHSLIKKDKIGNIEFREDKRYFTDYDFMINIFDKCDSFIGVEEAIYAKRTRDDPVNLTSLNQELLDDNFLLYIEEYDTILNIINSKSDEKYLIFKSEINRSLYKFYYSKFSHYFLKNKDDRWRTIYFDKMSEVSKNFDLNNVKFMQKKELKALQAKDKEEFQRLIEKRSARNRFKKLFRKRWLFKASIYNKYYNNQPINQNQIIFESFLGKYYSDSPKYLYEYLYNNFRDDFEFVWVINDKHVKIPGNPKKVKRFSLEYYKEVAKSKYWVINGRQAARLKKRDDQIIVSTWHGTPLKKLGLDIGNIHTRNPNIKKSYIKIGRNWDYLISPNRYTTNILRSSFAYEGEILESGYPRNDILYNATNENITKIKQNLNIPSDKKVILYAPTWRDDEYIGAGKINFELKLELDKLQKELSDEYIILVRTHYFIANNLNLKPYKGFAFDVCDYDDIAELYLVSDILITDYSSVFFDFANLKRPILYYTYDLEKYENVLRGFYIDIHTEVPGPLLKTTEEVIDSIKNIEKIKSEYSDKYDEFYERFCSIDDGNASKRIYENVWKK